MILTADLVYWQGRARQRYGRTTPWRLGAVAGRAGYPLTNPYDAGRPSRQQFDEGMRWGEKQRLEALSRLAPQGATE